MNKQADAVKGIITLSIGNDWMSNDVRAAFNRAEPCGEQLPRDLKLVLVKLLTATRTSDSIGGQAGFYGTNVQDDYSRSRAAARVGVRAANAGLFIEMAANRLVHLIQEKIIPHFPIMSIHFKTNCIWINGQPINKLYSKTGYLCSSFSRIAIFKIEFHLFTAGPSCSYHGLD